MKPADQRKIRRLPRTSDTWLVGLFGVPVDLKDSILEGVLLTLESDRGVPRAAAPVAAGEGLGDPLAAAFLRPVAPGRPGRPRRIRCVGTDLARRLRAEVDGLGIEVEVATSLPALEDLARRLAARFSASKAPGLTVSLGLWAPALRRLCTAAPWVSLSDAVEFRFQGVAPLEGTVALVLGMLDEQVGVVLYTSEQSYEEAAWGGPEPALEAIAGVEALILYLESAEDLYDDEVDACRRLDLVLPGDRYPRAAAMRHAGLVPLTEADQRALLAAIEAILALWDARGAALEEVAASVHARTCLGPVTVSSTPPEPDFEDVTTLALRPYALGVADLTHGEGEGRATRPAVVVTQERMLASVLARRLSEVDAISVESAGRHHVAIRAWAGDDDLGIVAVGADIETDRLLPGQPAWLCVSIGASERATPGTEDILWIGEVDVLRDESRR